MTGIVLLIGAIALNVYASTFPVREGVSPVLSAGFYPRLLGGILGVLAVLLIIMAVVRPPSSSQKTAPIWKSSESFRLFWLTLGALLAYPFVMMLFGFALTGFLFILLLITGLSEKGARRPTVIAAVSIGITLLTVLVFQVFLRIPFPTGLIFQ